MSIEETSPSRESTEADRSEMSPSAASTLVSIEETSPSRESTEASRAPVPKATMSSRESTEASRFVIAVVFVVITAKEAVSPSICLILTNAIYILFIFRPKDTLCAFISIYKNGSRLFEPGAT